MVTVTLITLPAGELEVPLSVICVADCAVMVRGVLSSNATLAEAAKPVPVMVRVNGSAVVHLRWAEGTNGGHHVENCYGGGGDLGWISSADGIDSDGI